MLRAFANWKTERMSFQFLDFDDPASQNDSDCSGGESDTSGISGGGSNGSGKSSCVNDLYSESANLKGSD
jgi:hypothetical protein